MLTQFEIKELQALWIKIAPHELFDYKATCLERKGLFELNHPEIKDFFAPSEDGAIYHVSELLKDDEQIWNMKHS